MFFKKKDKEDNIAKFLKTIRNYIEEADKHNSSVGSCENYIMPRISSIIKTSENEIRSWKDSDQIELMAVKVLYNVSFDTLSSGKLNMYRGQLDPMKPGNTLIYIVEQCLSYYLDHGILSKEQKDDQLSILWENIESVG